MLGFVVATSSSTRNEIIELSVPDKLVSHDEEGYVSLFTNMSLLSLNIRIYFNCFFFQSRAYKIGDVT